LIGSGIRLIKYRFSISDEERHLPFRVRIRDPLKQWKLSPMYLVSRRRGQYTKAKKEIVERTHIAEVPWSMVNADEVPRREHPDCAYVFQGWTASSDDVATCEGINPRLILFVVILPVMTPKGQM
jgi:polyphosphate kinase 2 (PPK2 family)